MTDCDFGQGQMLDSIFQHHGLHMGSITEKSNKPTSMGDLQDPKVEVLYHIRAYFLGIFPYIGLKKRPYIW